MDNIYIVLWRGGIDDKWCTDGCYTDKNVAEAKLNFERLNHPGWQWVVAECTVKATLTSAE